MNLDGLKALIINPDIGSRSRLREVLKYAVYKISLSYMQSLKEASERMETLCENEVVLLSTKLGEDQVRSFISAIVNGDASKHPSFIVTLEGNTHDMISRVSSLYLDGVEGFITEPYSSHDLLSLLTAIKSKKSKEDTLTKQKKTMQFVFQESARCIDVLSKCYAMEKAIPSTLVKEVKNLCGSTKSLYEQNAELYASILADVFEKIEPPANQGEQRRRKKIKELLLHPGKIISDLMRDRNLTLDRLKTSMKVDSAQFQEFLDAKITLDEPMARELSRLFGKTARDWLKMQKEFDHQQEILASRKSLTQDGSDD